MDKLIEKYVYNCVKGLPKNMREEVSNEIRGLISDMLEDRCKDFAPDEKDVRVVLAELGTPLELRQNYCVSKQDSLISGLYFYVYKKTLPIVLLALLFGLTIASLLENLSSGFSFELIVTGVGNFVGGSVVAFAIVTLIFAVMQHFKINIDYTRNVDSLEMPPKQQNKKAVSKVEAILDIVALAVFPLIFLMFNSVVVLVEGTENPLSKATYFIINQPQLLNYIYLFVLISIVGIVGTGYSLHQKEYNKKVFAILAVANVVQLIIMAFILFGTTVFLISFTIKLIVFLLVFIVILIELFSVWRKASN